MELYLIRHAQSSNQLLDDPEARVFDPRLTDLGERQALLLAQHLGAGKERARSSGEPIDSLLCSPMWRALQTARPLSEALDLAPEAWVDVHEQIYATETYAGSTRHRIQAAFPDYVLPPEITDEGWWNRAGESVSECMERAIRVAESLRERAEAEERIAIVSHARFLDSLLKAFLDRLPGSDSWYHHFNTGVSRLGLGGDRLDVRYLNRVDHLPAALVS
ncbi:MAG: histidine phosphatase family protein [Chloroflexota bacterium]|nr:histidine phosphatase family protein [Chloroflexota bacterium]